MMSVSASGILAFLTHWFGRCAEGQLLEVRPLHRGQKALRREWFDGIEGAFDHVLTSVKQGDDVYVGALPRARRGGKEEDIAARCWLWTDVDYGIVGHKS